MDRNHNNIALTVSPGDVIGKNIKFSIDLLVRSETIASIVRVSGAIIERPVVEESGESIGSQIKSLT